MGDIAEMMLNGTLCEGCGVAFGDRQSPGFPRYCPDCADPIAAAFAMKRQVYGKVNCPECGKRVKASGLADHARVVHSTAHSQEPAP